MLSDEIQGCLKTCSNILCGKMQILGAVTPDNVEDFSALQSAAEHVNGLLNDEPADEDADERSVAFLYNRMMEFRHARK